MTKEQIEQAANERFPDLAIDNDNTQAHKRYGFIAGATSPEAAAYHGQGCDFGGGGTLDERSTLLLTLKQKKISLNITQA